VTLLVDIGNSRVKWARLAGGAIGPQQAADYAQWSVADWHRELFAQAPVRRVVVATVAGERSAQALREAARQSAACEVHFVATTGAAAGVRNGYPEPALLGVDRWVAVIAAHHLTHEACCVVDIGTAATIDAVTADGQHLGGFIVPGPQLMADSLLHGTSDLLAHASAGGSAGPQLFATNTRDAIDGGCRVALAALADRAVDDLQRRTRSRPVLLFTGGAAPLVVPQVRSPVRQVPDLVLRGLAVLAAEPA
jgi:type III pantothenate kinase